MKNYAEHYHNLEALKPMVTRMENKDNTVIFYLGNSNCALIKEEGYGRIWPEILTAELKCYFQMMNMYHMVMGMAGTRWSGILENREVIFDRYTPDLYIVYCGKRINFSKDYTEYLDDLEKVLTISSEKAHVLAVTSIPMFEIDTKQRKTLNKIWDAEEHRQKTEDTMDLIVNKMGLPCVDLHSIWKEMHENDVIESVDCIERGDTAHPGILGQFLVARTVRKAFFDQYESIFGGH